MHNIRNVDLNLLIAFDALYDTGNVTRAAERLALTQPTVSGMLTRLRALFGDPLFVRTQHGILPTPRADALSEPIKGLLANVEALVAPDEFDPGSAQTTISISANDYMQQALIVPFLDRLRRQAPSMRLAVMPAYIDDLKEKLARGTVDLAVTIPEFADPGLPRSLLYTERYVCVARGEHPLKSKKPSLEDFCRFDHIMVSPTSGSFVGPTDDALAQLGVSRRVSVSLPSFHVLLESIRVDDFLALVPERLLYGRMTGLRLLEPPVSVPNFDVIACWHPRVGADPGQRWIRALLGSVAKELSAGSGNSPPRQAFTGRANR
jgi:DNA-binding transcriptional LysR family regulator